MSTTAIVSASEPLTPGNELNRHYADPLNMPIAG
jgi:hypothetical protein